MEKKKLIIILIVSVIAALVIGFIIGKSTNSISIKIGDLNESKSGETNETKREATKLSLGEQITSQDIEMSVISIDFKEEIKWQTGERSTMSAYLENGKIAFSLAGNFKNLRGDKINSDSIIGKVIINDKYTYDLSFKPHISGYSVDPLNNVEYDFYAQITEDVKNTITKAEFIFGYNNDFGYITNTYDLTSGKMKDKFEGLDNLYSVVYVKE